MGKETGSKETGTRCIRRIAAVICMAALAAGAFSACGEKNSKESLLDRNSPVTLTIWHYYNGIQQTQFDELVEQFNNTIGSEKGIYVEAVSKNSVNELAEGVLASVQKEPGAEEAPDIFGTYVETAYQIDKLGMLADLSEYLTDKELDEYVDEYIAEGAFAGEGTLKVFPTAKSTEVMIVNATDWQKFADSTGVTYDDLSTWEGLVEVSEKYYAYTDGQTPDVQNDGKAFFGRDSVANYMIIGAKELGHPFVEMAKAKQVDEDTMRRLWENYYVPFVKGYFTAESRFRSDDAKIGEIIALVCSTTGAIYYPEEVTVSDTYTYPIENVVLPVPDFEGEESFLVQQGAGMAVVKSNEKKEYASTVFLKWFTENEQNIRFSMNSGYLPVRKSANDPEIIFADENDAPVSETMKKTLTLAIEEIKDSTLYTSLPYEQSAEVRSYIGETMETTSVEAREAADARIAAGEDRETVLAEYTDEGAFVKWFAAFDEGFKEIIE